MYITSIRYNAPNIESFPYSLPLFKNFTELSFTKPVTLFVGENGTGKSTLLETIACLSRMISVTSESETSFEKISDFASHFKLSRSLHPKHNFFLRSDDFLGYIKRLTAMREEAVGNLKQIETEYEGKSQFAKDMARSAHMRTLAELKQLYGDGLEYASHGESFLAYFQSRFKPSGLYLLDEPEVPLSPIKQLTLISLIKELVRENSQFIIATHSPILMALPEAEILCFDEVPLKHKSYEELEHVRLTKEFLENPERYLNKL